MRLVNQTPWLYKIDGVKCATTPIALVSSGILLVDKLVELHIVVVRTGNAQCGHMPSTYRSAKNLEQN